MDGCRYKCPFSKHLGCKKEFYRKDKLKEHILTHSANENLKCERCSRVFKRQSKLKQHESVCLSEDHPCKDCGHVTTSLVSGSMFYCEFPTLVCLVCEFITSDYNKIR